MCLRAGVRTQSAPSPPWSWRLRLRQIISISPHNTPRTLFLQHDVLPFSSRGPSRGVSLSFVFITIWVTDIRISIFKLLIFFLISSSYPPIQSISGLSATFFFPPLTNLFRDMPLQRFMQKIVLISENVTGAHVVQHHILRLCTLHCITLCSYIKIGLITIL